MCVWVLSKPLPTSCIVIVQKYRQEDLFDFLSSFPFEIEVALSHKAMKAYVRVPLCYIYQLCFRAIAIFLMHSIEFIYENMQYGILHSIQTS